MEIICFAGNGPNAPWLFDGRSPGYAHGIVLKVHSSHFTSLTAALATPMI